MKNVLGCIASKDAVSKNGKQIEEAMPKATTCLIVCFDKYEDFRLQTACMLILFLLKQRNITLCSFAKWNLQSTEALRNFAKWNLQPTEVLCNFAK